MNMQKAKATIFIVTLVLILTAGLAAQELAEIRLPKPQTDGGVPLMQALARRATSRDFAPDPLPAQTLSNLLWAAWGINRPESKKRTAPSAMNWQEIDLYIVMEMGIYLYDATAHVLKPVMAGDFRAQAGRQEFVKTVPLTLVFVADPARMGKAPAEKREIYAWTDSAFISQNVYLFCASAGLATGVRASVDAAALATAMKLTSGQIITMAQSVGFPKK
ncbi:MAG TPA: SagB/ThcOx family dehydrogenase [Patescibacteria group bacterium]|nr:SagB/ThcOx family dehydrogenase [Patescibacteria group bacterium]